MFSIQPTPILTPVSVTPVTFSLLIIIIITSHARIAYPLNEQWAPLAVYGKRAPLQRKLRGQHKLTRKAETL